MKGREGKEGVAEVVADSGSTLGGLKCHKCGREYLSNRGGWFDKHVRECGEEQKSVGLACPKCGAAFKSKLGGWYTRHVNSCGSSLSLLDDG